MSELRDELVAGIRASREKFESAGDRAEELRTLPHDAVAILRVARPVLAQDPGGAWRDAAAAASSSAT